ncbi:MAG: hypothetical protein RMJ00_02165 [Nitrososphaerota archaeon]|nr:hypothetical protein [Candidatus Bathyarchaeota archaeon]MDW8061485.1 hypothetical protein [Nitrososphaerota archaeon]
MRVDGLQGEHILGDLWRTGVDEGYRKAGLSSAHFEIPPSRKVTIITRSGMEVDWNPDPIGHPRIRCFHIKITGAIHTTV